MLDLFVVIVKLVDVFLQLFVYKFSIFTKILEVLCQLHVRAPFLFLISSLLRWRALRLRDELLSTLELAVIVIPFIFGVKNSIVEFDIVNLVPSSRCTVF